MCHRATHAHDCGMMEHHHDASGSGSSGVAAFHQDEKCPMSCCMQASSATARPATSSATSTPLLIFQAFTPFESQVFTAAGFSSHTDRGPPSMHSFS